MKIGILEFGYGDEKSNSLVRLKNVFDYAIHADKLGYNRFWMAEHHMYSRKLAWGCPVSLVPVIAGFTFRIKIGTGGILLRIHDPLDIAAQFKLWNNIYRGRIDLGLANGGSFNGEMLAIKNPNKLSFDSKFDDLVNFLMSEEKLFEKQIVLPPYKGHIPDLWSLSTSANGFHRSLNFGTNYVRSIFHEKADLEPNQENFIEFKQEFKSQYGKNVKTILAISGTCLKNERRLKEIKNNSETDEQNHIIGNINFFKDKLPELLELYQTDEILFRDMNRDNKEKTETLEALSIFLEND